MKFLKIKRYSILSAILKYSFVVVFAITLIAPRIFTGNFVKMVNATVDNNVASITDFSPKEGPAGTMVTVVGENLTGINNVYFGILRAVTTDSSETQMNVRVPDNAPAGAVSITVSTDNNGSATSMESFRVTPASTSATPAAGTNPQAPNVKAKSSGTIVWHGIVPECNSGDIDPITKNYINACDFNMVIRLINRVISFILVDLATPLFALIIIYVAWIYLSAGGSSEKVSKAKDIFKNAIIGYVVIMAAWLIVKAILLTLGFKGESYLG